jgi:Ankyrin repeats (3 copies)
MSDGLIQYLLSKILTQGIDSLTKEDLAVLRSDREQFLKSFRQTAGADPPRQLLEVLHAKGDVVVRIASPTKIKRKPLKEASQQQQVNPSKSKASAVNASASQSIVERGLFLIQTNQPAEFNRIISKLTAVQYSESFLETAIKCDRYEFVQNFGPSDLKGTRDDGRTLIHLAVEYDAFDSLKILLADSEPSFYAELATWLDKEGRNPFHLSCCLKSERICSFLLHLHYELLFSKDKEGRTGVFYGITQKNAKLVNFLLKRGADLRAADVYGTTAMDILDDLNDEDFKAACLRGLTGPGSAESSGKHQPTAPTTGPPSTQKLLLEKDMRIIKLEAEISQWKEKLKTETIDFQSYKNSLDEIENLQNKLKVLLSDCGNKESEIIKFCQEMNKLKLEKAEVQLRLAGLMAEKTKSVGLDQSELVVLNEDREDGSSAPMKRPVLSFFKARAISMKPDQDAPANQFLPVNPPIDKSEQTNSNCVCLEIVAKASLVVIEPAQTFTRSTAPEEGMRCMILAAGGLPSPSEYFLGFEQKQVQDDGESVIEQYSLPFTGPYAAIGEDRQGPMALIGGCSLTLEIWDIEGRCKIGQFLLEIPASLEGSPSQEVLLEGKGLKVLLLFFVTALIPSSLPKTLPEMYSFGFLQVEIKQNLTADLGINNEASQILMTVKTSPFTTEHRLVQRSALTSLKFKLCFLAKSDSVFVKDLLNLSYVTFAKRYLEERTDLTVCQFPEWSLKSLIPPSVNNGSKDFFSRSIQGKDSSLVIELKFSN